MIRLFNPLWEPVWAPCCEIFTAVSGHPILKTISRLAGLNETQTDADTAGLRKSAGGQCLIVSSCTRFPPFFPSHFSFQASCPHTPPHALLPLFSPHYCHCLFFPLSHISCPPLSKVKSDNSTALTFPQGFC